MGKYLTLASASLLAIAVANEASAQSTDGNEYDALGRLVVTVTTGGANDDQARSTCYDPAGNRTEYRSSNDGSLLACAPPPTPPTPPPPAPPPPTPPPPPPGNSPPVAENDVLAGTCNLSDFISLTVNDTDPDGHYPLTVTSITRSHGSANAFMVNGSIAEVYFGPEYDSSVFTYTVADSLGATDTGTLWVSTFNCEGGGLPPQ